MAMRDPGTPGRNPFFDHGTEDPFASDAGSAPGGDHGDESAYDAYVRSERARNAAGPPIDTSALGTLVGLVDALGQAQPEAGEHLLAAAHELVLAVKTVVDATESVLAQQRAAMAERNADGRAAAASEAASDSASESASDVAPEAAAHQTPRAADDAEETERRAGVYRIDLA
jgi:hypothetical protein